eukprot:5065824-Prymnesium_polylepis.1
MRIVRAYVARRQRTFDLAQPPSTVALDWEQHRRRLQAAGQLTPTAEQSHPQYLQVFTDDLNGASGVDHCI